jgi:hypothetical protein
MQTLYNSFPGPIGASDMPWQTGAPTTQVLGASTGLVVFQTANSQLTALMKRLPDLDVLNTTFANSGCIFSLSIGYGRAMRLAGQGNGGVMTILLPGFTGLIGAPPAPAIRFDFGATAPAGTTKLGKALLANPSASFSSLGGVWNGVSIGAPFTFDGTLQVLVALRPSLTPGVHQMRAVLYKGTPLSDDLPPQDSGWITMTGFTYPSDLADPQSIVQMKTDTSFTAPIGTQAALGLTFVQYDAGMTAAETELRMRYYLNTLDSSTFIHLVKSVAFSDATNTQGTVTLQDDTQIAFSNCSADGVGKPLAFDMSRMQGPIASANPMPASPIFYADYAG